MIFGMIFLAFLLTQKDDLLSPSLGQGAKSLFLKNSPFFTDPIYV